MALDLLFVFLTGLIYGAGHCVGMCGGFVTAYTLSRPRPASRSSLGQALSSLPAHLSYNLGRVTIYTLLGAFMGLIGSLVEGTARLAGLQGVATTVAGLLMIFWAVAKVRGRTLFEWGALSPFRWEGMKRLYKKLTQDRRLTGPLFLGLLLGFMPCGLIATMELKAAGTGSLGGGMLIMLFFGLGTAPSLIAFGTLSAWLSQRFRRRLDHVAALLVGAAGALSVLRGLAENDLIPHVNPWLW